MSSPTPDRTPNRPGARRVRSVLAPVLAAVVLAGWTACGGEEEAAPGDTAGLSTRSAPGQSGPSAAPSGAMAEFQQVQRQLSSLQQRALQDSALQQRMERVRALLERTMREMNPQTARRLDRMDSLSDEFRSARAAGDTTRIRSLMQQLRRLERGLQSAQSQAMQTEEVAAAIDTFEQKLRARMQELGPADSLRSRAESLQAQIQSGSGAPLDTGGAGG